MKPVVVMKFGGTSVSSVRSLGTLVDVVKRERRRHPLLVVSALAGVTNLLVKFTESIRRQHAGETAEILEQLRERHYSLARNVVSDQNLPQLKHDLAESFGSLTIMSQNLLKEGRLPREKSAWILSFGERLSSRIIHGILLDHFDRAYLMDTRQFMVIDPDLPEAAPIVEETAFRIKKKLLPTLHKGRVTLIQGFIGATREGFTATLGRGGSDYTATFIASLIGAEETQIWTDVNGILTADPRVVPEAKTIPFLYPEQAAELASRGAKVLHPHCLQPIKGTNIKVFVRNTFNPDHMGTLLHNAPTRPGPCFSVSSKAEVRLVYIKKQEHLPAEPFQSWTQQLAMQHLNSVDGLSWQHHTLEMLTSDEVHLPAFKNAFGDKASVVIGERYAQIFILAACEAELSDPLAYCGDILDKNGIPRYFSTWEAERQGITFAIDREKCQQAVILLHQALSRRLGV